MGAQEKSRDALAEREKCTNIGKSLISIIFRSSLSLSLPCPNGMDHSNLTVLCTGLSDFLWSDLSTLWFSTPKTHVLEYSKDRRTCQKAGRPGSNPHSTVNLLSTCGQDTHSVSSSGKSNTGLAYLRSKVSPNSKFFDMILFPR